MDKMLGKKTTVLQCPYGCCTIKASKKTIRTREKRAWKQEAREV